MPAPKLPEIGKRIDDVLKHGNLTHASAHVIKPLVQQGRLLARQYDAVVANPPYMGSKSFNPTVKQLIATNFIESRGDLYAAFIQRALQWSPPSGFVGMVTMRSWMFLPSYEELRSTVITHRTISSLVFIGYNSFLEMNSKNRSRGSFLHPARQASWARWNLR